MGTDPQCWQVRGDGDWPGADGADIRIAGTLVQAAIPIRTVDYTVPFGGLGAQGFALTAAQFAPASPALTAQIVAAGVVSLSPASPVLVTAGPFETVFCAPVVLATPPCGTRLRDAPSGVPEFLAQ